MTEEVIQKLVKKLTKDIKVDISVIPPIGATFLRKYSTNGTIPLATFASLITFTLSYFIGSALTNTRAESQSIHGYVITASILSSFLILSLILNSWYRAIAKNEKIGTELLNSDLNKGDKGEIDEIKIILDFRGGRTLEYIVPISLDKQGELIQHIREDRYRILLLSIPIIMPAVTLFAVLAANEFNIKNLYIAIPVLILFFSISLAKLGFTVHKAKDNKMNDYTFSQFSNKDILLNFNSKSWKITIINEQYKKQDVNQEEEKMEVEYEPSVTRSGSTDTMYSAGNTEIVQPLFITDNRQEESGSWLSGAGAKVGKALGEKIAQPVGQAAHAIEQACTGILKAAQKVEQMGCDVSELKEPIKQMREDVSSASRQLKQTSKDVSEAAKQVNQTSAYISRLVKKIESYFPNDNTYSNIPLADILSILKSKLKAKGENGNLDDTISNLVDGKVIVTYKKGSTLEFITPAKKAGAREEMSRFTELNVEGLGVTVGKNGFIFDSK